MDRDFEKSSDVIPVTLKKDQTPVAGSKVANAEEFDVITRFAREKLREIGRNIRWKCCRQSYQEQENRQLRILRFSGHMQV